MNKKILIPLLAIPFILTSCGPTSDPNTTDENPTISESETTTGSSISAELVQEKLANRVRLKNHIVALGEKELIKVNYSFETNIGGKRNTEARETHFRSNEVYSVTNFSDTYESETKTSKNTLYYGIVDGIYYASEVDSNVPALSYARRYKVVETSEEVVAPDYIISETATTSITDSKKANTIDVLISNSYWKNVLDNNLFKETKYEIDIREDYVRLVMEGYTTGYLSNTYVLICTFDENINLQSGVLTTNRYTTENWDKDNKRPIENAEISTISKISLDGVEYGEPLTTGTKPMTDLSKYFVTSLGSNIQITNFVTDSGTGTTYFSDPNTLIIGEPVEAPVEYIKENNLYSPSTAIDVDKLYITKVSNENAISKDAYGWVVTGKPGDKVTISIGNSFNPSLAEVEVELVKSPIKNHPTFAFSIKHVEGDIISYQANLSRPVLKMAKGSTAIFQVATHNKAPFDSYPLTYKTFTQGVVSAKTCDDQTTYVDAYGSNGVYCSISALEAGSTVFAFMDSRINEGIYEIEIIVE